MNDNLLKTILLVEDETILALTQKKQLEKYGYTVVTANTGEKAIEIIENGSGIDLILMDIDLGKGLNGPETATLILKEYDIPIVFLSSHTEPHVVEKTEKITSYGYVVKNSGITVLDASIKMAFKLFDAKEKIYSQSIRNQAIVQSLPDHMFVFNREGVYLEAFTSDESTFPIPASGIIGKKLSEVFGRRETKRLLDILNICLETGKLQVCEAELSIDGNVCLYEARLSKMDSDKILALVRNITDRKKAEDAINAQNEDLNALNEELNAAMEEMSSTNEELISTSIELQAKEIALQNDNNFIEALLESIPGYLYVYDENMQLIRWNKKHEEMTGYSGEELKNMTLEQRFEGEDLIKVKAAIEEIFNTGYGDVEANLKIKNGKKLHVHLNGVKLIIDGKMYFTGVGVDITESRQAMDALKESELRYRNIFENVQDIFYQTDMNGIIIEISPSVERYTGFTREELIGTPVENVYYDPQDRNKLLMILSASGEVIDYELRLKAKNDRVIITSTSSHILIDSDGKPAGVEGSLRDITERTIFEEALKESEQIHRLLTDNATDVIWTMDLSGHFTYISPSIEKLRGYTVAEVMQQSIGETLMPESAVIAQNFFTAGIEALKNGGNFPEFRGELEHTCKDGSSVWIEATVSVMCNTYGEVIGIVGVSRDISERKISEDKIKALLAEKELILKEVHHRIKNNMNTLSSLLTLQAETLEEPSAIAALADAGTRLQSMMVLYDKLYQSVDFKEISFQGYLSSLVDEVIGNFPNSSSVKINKSIDDFIIDVKLLQPLGIIINELLTNIMKYAFTGRSSGIITVSAALAATMVIIVIQDNGNIIPESINFENSTGFGLMLVGMLTKQIGGKIRIERGGGTKIILVFEK